MILTSLTALSNLLNLFEIRAKQMFSSNNIKLLILSFVLLIVGYILLGQGPVKNPLSLSVAPVILVFTYCLLIPFALLYKGKEKDKLKQKQGV